MENRPVPEDFRFNKALGQNFLTDKNLLASVCKDAGIEKGDTVVEIGTGAGTLTKALCEAGAKVFTFEVDRRLEEIVKKNLDGMDYTMIIGDVLRMSDEEIKKIVPEPFKVVANLPYYITTPLIMRFLESELDYISLTITIQKEVAERLLSEAGTPDYGAVTVAVRSYCDVVLNRTIDRRMFFPSPKVDSTVITLKKHENKYKIQDRKLFRNLVKCVFSARRKTLENNLKSGFSLKKEQCEILFNRLNLPPMIRGEKLSVEQFKSLADGIAETLNS